MAPRNLNPTQQVAVVKWLARGATPSEVARLVMEHFEVKTSRQSVEYYDPTKARGQTLSRELADLFYAERDAYFEELDRTPIAQPTVRLRRLERLYEIEAERGDTAAAAAILAQAAKEAPGAAAKGGYRDDHAATLESVNAALDEIQARTLEAESAER